MGDLFQKRVRAAAVAAWWALLAAGGLVLLASGGLLWMARESPRWLVSMWGGQVAWSTIVTVGLWMIALFRVAVWLLFVTTVWLTIWAAKLRRVDAGAR